MFQKLNYHIPTSHQRSLLSCLTDLDMYPGDEGRCRNQHCPLAASGNQVQTHGCLWSLHALTVIACFLQFPLIVQKHAVRFIGDCKLPISVNELVRLYMSALVQTGDSVYPASHHSRQIGFTTNIFNLHMLKIFIMLDNMQLTHHNQDLSRGHPVHLPLNCAQRDFLHST